MNQKYHKLKYGSEELSTLEGMLKIPNLLKQWYTMNISSKEESKETHY